MNLENQTVTGIGEVTVNDSLNAALMELTIKRSATSVAPSANELFIYVDKMQGENPSEERKQYLFELKDILRTYNNVSDEFKQRLEVVNNDIVLRSYVERKVSYDSETDECSLLEKEEIEELESYPITLFEGINYIYTNYSDADISLIYTKDTLDNKIFLNGSMYYHHKLRNDGEFCLDDIYFKDAFTKTGNDLNIEVNNASIDSLSSNNNKFSLDEEGNLVVNTITCNNSNSANQEDILDLIYPIGSICVTSTNANPSIPLGGSWELIDKEFKNQYLYYSNTGLATMNNLSQLGARVLFSGHTVQLECDAVLKANLTDTTLLLCTFDRSKLGFQGTVGDHMHYIVGYSDGGNNVFLASMSSNSFQVNALDALGDGSHKITSGRTIVWSQSIVADNFTSMLDSYCDKFYWKRIS